MGPRSSSYIHQVVGLCVLLLAPGLTPESRAWKVCTTEAVAEVELRVLLGPIGNARVDQSRTVGKVPKRYIRVSLRYREQAFDDYASAYQDSYFIYT